MTRHFKIYEHKIRQTTDLYVVQKRRLADIEAPKLRDIRSGVRDRARKRWRSSVQRTRLKLLTGSLKSKESCCVKLKLKAKRPKKAFLLLQLPHGKGCERGHRATKTIGNLSKKVSEKKS